METSAILMNVIELANYINIKEKTIYSKVEAKEIPHFRIGGLIRFKKSEIDQWIEGQRVGVVSDDAPRGRTRRIIEPRNTNVDRIVRKIIDRESRSEYTSPHGKSDRIEGPWKEINNGSI